MTEQLTIEHSSGEWLTTDETCRILGKALRTVQEMAKAGMLKYKMEARPGTKPQRLYDARDVRREAPPASLPQPYSPPRPARPAPPRQLEAPVLVEESKPPAPAKESVYDLRQLRLKLWLTVEEASAYSGFGRKHLLDLIETRSVQAEKWGVGGAWIIRRASLESSSWT